MTTDYKAIALGTLGDEWPRTEFRDGLMDILSVFAGTFLIWVSIRKAPE